MSTESDELDAESDEGQADTASARRRLFPDDNSTLTLQQRSTLIKLIKQPFLSAADHPDEWDTLMESRSLITARMHDLLLDLRLDATSRVAYKVRAPLDDDLVAPSLLRNTRWTANQTALLVVLRERLRLRAIPTDPVYVDLDELVAAMNPMLPKTVDEQRPRKLTEAALEPLARLGIVKLAPGSEDRYRISPVLESLLPVAKLRQLLEVLNRTNSEAGTTEPGEAPDRPGLVADFDHAVREDV
jgi:hypothetical protein